MGFFLLFYAWRGAIVRAALFRRSIALVLLPRLPFSWGI